jgi:hypothetical protein
MTKTPNELTAVVLFRLSGAEAELAVALEHAEELRLSTVEQRKAGSLQTEMLCSMLRHHIKSLEQTASRARELLV